MNRKEFVKNISKIALISAAPFAPVAIGWAEEMKSDRKKDGGHPKTTKLLSRLDLKKLGLESIKDSTEDSAQAARKLLAYYRSRHSVKTIIGRKPDHKVPGAATEEDMKMANDALKHIFVGQPDYSSYFVGEDIKWDTQPVDDKEWVWQLNRMYFWDAMGKAYWATNDEKFAREWSSQIVDWIEKNPRDGHHQYAWRSIEAGIRGQSWTELFQRFLGSPSFTSDVLVKFLNSCFDHATYLMNQYSKGSNWALMEAEGLAFISIIFPEFRDSKKWRNESIRRFKKEINRQVYADGFQRELTMGYHVGAISGFMRTFELGKINNLESAFPKFYLHRIEKMCEVPMKFSFPDGRTPQFGDSWVGEPGRYQEKFKKWAKLFDRDDFLYLATNGNKGVMPDAKAYALKKSGYYSMRSGWHKNAICLILKCGPDGGFHSQPDNGTFSLYAGDRLLMPDSGSYNYGSEEPKKRAWFRQTKVHQTLTLNGKNSAYAPELLLWEPGENLDKLVVENQSYENLKHRRAVLFVEKKFFIIIDEAIGDASGEVDLHFQLAPGNAILNKENLTVQSDFEQGWNIFVQTQDQQGIKLEKEKGQVSFVYTEKERRPAFRYRVHKNLNRGIRFVTVVVPYQEKNPPQINAQIMGDPEIGSTQMNLEVLMNGETRQIKYNLK